MKIKSLDPRITREEIDKDKEFEGAKEMDQWQTYEVFHQVKRGQHHQHVGCVHAPSPEMAVLFGKEQYSRRGQCVNLWVVKSSDIFATEYEDADIFETTVDKIHRDPGTYKVMDKINAYKERIKQKS
jgi:ring-1,2-phenylacetyl-CoA epoxidase subunit PaaB